MVAAVVLASVLTFGGLTATLLEVDALGGYVEGAARGEHQILEALLGLGLRNLARRLIFLDVQTIAVDIDGGRVFGQIGVVDAIALDLFTFEPALQALAILVDAVVDHLGTGAAEAHRCIGAVLGRGRDRTGDQQTFEAAVVDLLDLLGAQLGGPRQRVAAGDQGKAPADKALLEGATEFAVQRHQFAFLPQALAIRQIAHDQTGGKIRGRLQAGRVQCAELAETSHARGLQLAAGDTDGLGITVAAKGASAHLAQTLLGALIGCGPHLIPQAGIVPAPA